MQEAYEALRLRPYDANNKYGSGISDHNRYSFWALVNNIPCDISIQKEGRGIKLMVTRGEDHNFILRSQGLKENNIPKNLKSIV